MTPSFKQELERLFPHQDQRELLKNALDIAISYGELCDRKAIARVVSWLRSEEANKQIHVTGFGWAADIEKRFGGGE